MACGSCGGGGVVTASKGGSNGVVARGGVPVRYVWRWTAVDNSQSHDFASEDEARAHIKTGHAGSLMVVPS